MNTIHDDLDLRRKARHVISRANTETGDFLHDPRVVAIRNEAVQFTVARLLYVLRADPRTLRPDSAHSMASCELEQSLIDSYCESMDDYIATVGRTMTRLTMRQPKHLIWLPNARSNIITVAYIL